MDLSLVKILLVIIGFTGSILLITFLAIYYLRPLLLIKIWMWYKRQKSGVEIKYVKCKDYTFCYFCRGSPGPQPSMLLLHGFSASKDMWLDLIEHFPKDHHVVCVDMPGHGKTTRLEEESYTGTAQAARIHQFVECVGLKRKPFHLVGISMGGMVAGLYAALYPAEVYCLSLLCPAGLRTPTDSELIKRLKNRNQSDEEDNPLIPLTLKQGKDLIKLGVYQFPKNLSPQLLQTPGLNRMLKAYLDYQRPRHTFLKKCFADISSEDSKFLFHDNMKKIKAPLQVIWGKDDKMMDPSGAKVLADAFPSCQIHILEKCGHFIVADRSRKPAKLLLEFCTSVCTPAETKKLA